MPITALPTPVPTRADPANFSTRADTFLAALPQFVTDANTLATSVSTSETNAANSATAAAASATSASTQATNAANSATSAATQATNAATSASSAAGAPGTNATSSTSIAIATGSKSFNLVEANKAYSIGQSLVIASTASPSNFMVGQITAFTSSTGAITVNVTATGGSGTFTAWSVALTPIAGTVVTTVNGSSGAITGIATLVGVETFTNKTLTSPTINSPTVRVAPLYITTSQTLVSNGVYAYGANINMTLPLSPTVGDWINVASTGSFQTAALLRNSQNIMSLAQDLTLDKDYCRCTLVYVDSTRGWVITEN